MNAEPEGEVVVRRAGGVEAVWLREDGGIPVRGAEQRKCLLPLGDSHAVDLQILGGGPLEELQRRVMAQELLHQECDPGLVPWIEVAGLARREPTVQAVAETVDQCLVAGIEQQHRGGDQLVMRQLVTAIANLHQIGQQVLPWVLGSLRR